MSLKNLRTCTCHMPQFNDTFLDKSSCKSREALPDRRDTATAFHHQPCHSLLCNQTRDVIVRHWIFYLVSEYFHTRCTVLSLDRICKVCCVGFGMCSSVFIYLFHRHVLLHIRHDSNCH